jgi:AraC-like DNA-binding protein
MPACQILAHHPDAPRQQAWDTGWRNLPAVLIERPQGGSWRLDCEGMATMQIESGRMFAIPAGWRHRLRTKGGSSMTSTWCYLRWLDDAGHPWSLPGQPVVLDAAAARVLDDIAPESVPADEARSMAAAWRLAELLCSVAPPRSKAGDRRWRDLLAWLQAHLHEPLARQDLAMQAGLSASRLHDWCVTACGVAPMRLLARLRIERAQELLLCSDLPLGDIAERSGHGSPYWFSRAFRTATGQTPSAWRRAQRA